MAKAPTPKPMPTSMIPQRKALAMGKHPNTGCGTGPKTKS